MITPLVAEQREELAELCRRYRVQRLDLFGSAATDQFDPKHSDLDFLVRFDPAARVTYVGAFFHLHESLQALFDQRVDLVIETEFSNPDFREAVEQSRTSLYEAWVPFVSQRHSRNRDAHPAIDCGQDAGRLRG